MSELELTEIVKRLKLRRAARYRKMWRAVMQPLADVQEGIFSKQSYSEFVEYEKVVKKSFKL